MSQLFIYKIIFMTELLVSETLFSFYCQKQKKFPLRVLLSLVICYLVAVFYPLPNEIAYSGWYTSIMFLVMFITSFVYLKLSYKMDFVHTFFVGITAYTIQHLSYQLLTLLSVVFDISSMFGQYSSEVIDFSKYNAFSLIYALVYLSIYSTVYGFSFLTMSKKMNKSGKIEFKTTKLILVGGLILLVDIILNAYIVYIKEDYNRQYSIILCIYNLICCIFVFYIQFSTIKVSDMKQEVEVFSVMLHMRDKQFAMQKENINLINQKCHDIKYQLKQFVENKNVEELEHIVSIYDANYHSGNEVLDIILTEKSLYCNENKIQFTCMTNCKDLGFIQDSDLYCLFGNMIDNAIEAVDKFADDSQKCISININTQGELLTININNYYQGEIKLDDEGFPLTSKENNGYHGFGIRSIKSIVEKYNGSISIVTNNNIFRLNVLFPIPQNNR